MKYRHVLLSFGIPRGTLKRIRPWASFTGFEVRETGLEVSGAQASDWHQTCCQTLHFLIRRCARSTMRSKWGTQFGALRVTSTPAGLDVYIDGMPRGVTPFRADRVPVGDVTLRVQGLDGQASGQRVLVLPGRERSVDFPNGPKSQVFDEGSTRCSESTFDLVAGRFESRG